MTSTPSVSPAEPALPAADPTLGAQATRGVAWMTAQTLLAKLASLVGQAILAWLLFERDFALLALALAASAIPSLIQQIGIREILIQKQGQWDTWANGAFWLSACIGILTALAIAAVAPLAAYIYAEPRLATLILVLAAAAPFNSLATVPLVKLQSEMRHREVAVIGAAVAVVNPSLSILLAWLGWGPFAMVVPLTLSAAARLVLLSVAARFHPRRALDLHLWPVMFHSGIQLLFAHAFGLVINQADYMILGWFYRDQDAVLGIYFFAYNLSLQSVVMFLPNIQGVLLPALSRLQGEPKRQRASFLLTARTLAFLAFPICFLQAALADPGIRAIISPRFYPAIPVIAILSIGMAFRTAGWVIHGLIPAQGRYVTYTLIHFFGAIGFVVCVLAGAMIGTQYLGGASAVAVAVSMYFVVEAPIVLYVAMRPLNGSWSDILAMLINPMLPAAVAVGIASAAAWLVPASPLQHWLRLVIVPLVAVMVFVPLARWWMPELWESLGIRLAIMLKRRRAQAL